MTLALLVAALVLRVQLGPNGLARSRRRKPFLGLASISDGGGYWIGPSQPRIDGVIAILFWVSVGGSILMVLPQMMQAYDWPRLAVLALYGGVLLVKLGDLAVRAIRGIEAPMPRAGRLRN